MKFTNGYWLMRDGMEPQFAVEYCGHEIIDGAARVYAVACHAADRADYINRAQLTVAFTCPAPGAVRVELIHHLGAGDDAPILTDQRACRTPECTEEKDFLTLDCGGGLTARIDKRPHNWNLAFYDSCGTLLTESSWRGMAWIKNRLTGLGHTVAELSLAVGETVYGLGERFTPFVKNGQTVSIWNADGGTSSEQAYKNIPFYLSSRGYGVLVDSFADVEFEIASEKVSRVQFSLPRERLAFVLFAGPTPREVLERFTALTGRPALPPAWSFGLWLSTSFTTAYDEGTVTSFVNGMRERDIPLHVFHFDCFWMKDCRLCDLTWDRDLFPDPAGMLERLKSLGLRICLWINPYISQRTEMFSEGMSRGFLLKKRDGGIWQTDLWQPGMALVDFTNPDASAWFTGKLRALLEMGADSFKTDFGERIPVRDIAWFDGSDPVAMHNRYALLFNGTVFSLLEEARGTGEAVVFARSAAAGSQQFPVHWGGDCTASYASMAETLRGGLSLSLCGFGFWSHDIGGFENSATPDLYKRWCAFGLLSSHSRLHGSTSYRVPWSFDEESCDVLRHFVRIKCELMPYLYGQAVMAHQTGVPLMRPMVFAFPGDPACLALDTQYMLGGALLVAPIFSESGEVCYYLPDGRWTHYLTGEAKEGGRFFREVHDYFSLPLYVSPDTVLVTGARSDRPDYDYADGMTVRLYELRDGVKTVTVPDTKGRTAATLSVEKTGGRTRISADPSPKTWRVFISNETSAVVEGGVLRAEKTGVWVECHAGEVTLRP